MLVAYCLDLGSTVCCEVEGLMFEFEPAGSFSRLRFFATANLSSSADLYCCLLAPQSHSASCCVTWVRTRAASPTSSDHGSSNPLHPSSAHSARAACLWLPRTGTTS